MKGLLRKEWEAGLRSTWAVYALLAAAMWIGAAWLEIGLNFFFLAYPAIFISSLSSSQLQLEETDRWDSFSMALPVSRAQLVSVKYLTLLAEAAVGTLLMAAIFLVAGKGLGETLFGVSVFLNLLLLCAAWMLPCIFKWGAKIGRWVSVIVPAILFMGMIVGQLNVVGQGVDVTGLVGAGGIVTAVALVLLGISWRLSIRFYEKRDI